MLKLVSSALIGVVVIAAPDAGVSGTLRVPTEHPTIQGAIDAAAVGDTVLVAPGTYTECDGGDCLPAVVTLRTGVVVRSEAGPANTFLEGIDPPAGSVVDARSIGPMGATLTGFHVSCLDETDTGLNGLNSIKLEVRDCVFDGVRRAIGVNTDFADIVQIVDCVFRNCGNTNVDISGIQTDDIDVVIERCLFEGCGEERIVDATARVGNTFVMRDCVFRNNTVGTASALSTVDFVSAVVERCEFLDTGVGVVIRTDLASGQGFVRDCVFWNGSTPLKGAAATGSGPGTVEFVGNTAVGNFGGQNGAVFFLLASTSRFHNNIIAFSTGAEAVRTALVEVLDRSCNVFWENEGGHFVGYEPDSTDRIVDPLFCDWESGDLSVSSSSPCLPANSQGCGLIGARGEGCGSVSMRPTSWGQLKSLYREGD